MAVGNAFHTANRPPEDRAHRSRSRSDENVFAGYGERVEAVLETDMGGMDCDVTRTGSFPVLAFLRSSNSTGDL